MTNPVRDMLERAAKQDANRQAQIQAQKEVIDRLLKARIMEVSDKSLITDLCNERREVNTELFLLRATVEKVRNLLESESEYRVYELREAIKAALDG